MFSVTVWAQGPLCLHWRKKTQLTPTLHLSAANGFIKKDLKTSRTAPWETLLKTYSSFDS